MVGLVQLNPKRIDRFRIENLVIEIGFGNGVYISNLAKLFPDKNFLGIEVSGESIKKLVKRIRKENLKNVYCVKMDAYWFFYLFLDDNSVDQIYINFPDPWPKKRHAERRLTKIENLYLFSKKLKPNGFIQFKTDDLDLFNYTIENAKALDCFKIEKLDNFEDVVRTKYEMRWILMGRNIQVLRLYKIKEPDSKLELKGIRRIESMECFKGRRFDVFRLENKVFNIGENLVVKFAKVYERDDGWVIETLLSESGYVHYFFTNIKKSDDGYLISISQFSEVLKTEGLLKFLKWLASLDMNEFNYETHENISQ